ncbi:probable CSE1 - Nuclear envelope protein that mediates the nuclear export of importin alpha [Melanopsichium pennsylvanicum]|uniref:Probable CSE1 - Nuclear envelope protein that mediates the nuclear export of importin alpha n=2 Tax=Melanopsichium pennsylvanicum TaxID=63383 RepID=A0AAJ4XQW7_9BASI|nr:probable CSE1-Nuclear envelope protein that mediates the nuclear export of importin alpha [Melanopsichium pennsylvanicum 4]SNX87170.1 probable CSE1 - Nuclear envelope protein that mediates the nuclear export of importin alpha [Melanopsichium pennsylvanicum]
MAAQPSQQHLEHVCLLLSQTLDPTHRKAAELQLTQAQSQPGFLHILIAIIQNNLIQSSDPVRLAAAIKLKNICKTAWDQESAQDLAVDSIVPHQDKVAFKQNIIPLLTAISTNSNGTPPAPTNVRNQLEDAIALVAQNDFPHDWSELMDELVPKLSDQDDQLVLGILRTAHTIFYRWRSAFRSDALYSEINYVLTKFALPHLDLLKRTDQKLLDPNTPSASLPLLAEILNMALQVFYDLSSQDLPPHIEDNMQPITQILARWISASRPELDSDPDEPCVLQQIRSSICDIAELYAKRYLDAFPQLPSFVQAIWQMLGSCDLGHKYDTLVSKAVGFLSTVVRMGSSREMFQSTQTLEQLCSAIILPNIAIREADEELFEDNPIEYIRRDLETSMEADTRRKAASEFCRSLMEFFSTEVTQIVSRYILQYLEQYRANPQQNWKQKDTAIYLLTSIASKSSTVQHGVTSTNELVDVVQFFSDNVFADLKQSSDDSPSPILQVDAIKYLDTFRNQLTKQQLISVLPLLVQHLESSQYVTCSYASITIERILALKRDGKLLFTPTDVQPFAESILMALLSNIERGTTPEKLAENDYLMKCMLRMLATVRQAISSAYTPILSHLTSILSEISKNPSNPRFSQYLFESISALIRFTVIANPQSLGVFEQKLFPPFTAILSQDVAEFQPYVFQILSQMLELHTTQGLPDAYSSLLPPILMPACWENRGNVPALVRLVRAFLAKDAANIVQAGQLGAMLGIYQKLISTRINETYGLELLETLFGAVESGALEQYKRAILTLLLTRLQSSKTEKLVKGVIHLVSTMALMEGKGADYAIQAFDGVQLGLFSQIAVGVIAPELANVTQRQRKVVSVGFGTLLLKSSSMRKGNNLQVLPSLLASLLKLLLTPSSAVQMQAEEMDEVLFADEDHTASASFQSSFSRLAASETKRMDPTSDVLKNVAGNDVKVWFSGLLKEFRSQVGEEVWRGVWGSVDGELREAWERFMVANGVAF